MRRLNGRSSDAIEAIKRKCADMASEMQCRLHQRNARVEVGDDGCNGLDIEVFCCCEEFEGHVHRALKKVSGCERTRVSGDSEYQSGTAGQ
jgi:hypothetical protein